MAKINIALCLLVVVSVSSDPTTPHYVSYNSSDLSYLSNGIQFPVPAPLEHENVNETPGKDAEDKVPQMEWMTNLYNQHNWIKYLERLSATKCKQEMTTYIGELKNGTSWAAKMFDASGHYNTHFFYGNDFWLGSSSLCMELQNTQTNQLVPPFPVNFYVAKIRININEIFTPVTRQLIVGQCLPASCSLADIRTILIQERSQAKSLIVVDIRPVPGDYSIYSDRKFHIVGGTAFVITLLIIVATIVEIFTKKRKYKADEEIQNNNNNDNMKSNDALHMKDKKATATRKWGIPMQMLLSFSVVSNGKKILALDKVSRDSIRCIHGMRFFSITWIIMVHTYLEIFSIAENKTMRTVTERSFLYQTVSNATFSVDTFFFISGLLVTITYLRSAAKKKPPPKDEKAIQVVKTNSLKFLLLVFYRFIRLTPAYLFVIGVNELVLRFTHNNSVYSPAIIDHITCDAYWWRNALYINNFYPQHEFCMLWSWYIANDTQFYVLASILLVIAVRGEKHIKWVGAAIIAFLFTSWITTFVIAMKYNYVARVEEPFALFDQLYDKPWLRIGPYFIGMLTGYLLYKKETPMRIPTPLIILGWILSISCLLSLVYGFGREGLVVPLSAIYAALGHTAWGISLAWMTVACCFGYGGPIDSFLAFRGFLPLSRLTYCAYLIHPVIMVYTSFLMDGPIHLHTLNVLIIFMGNSVASFLIALLISLAFEAPVVRLLKIFLAPGSKDD